MKATAGGSKQGVTGAQMREAERTLKVMLGAKFPRAWIAEHSQEALGQALVEYQEWLESHPPARNPIAWLCTCGYRRAQNIRESERARPYVDPLDTVFHVADEKTPTPEQEVIDRDRQERLRKALSHLPEKEVKLLALVYFEGLTIREAGRKIGWQKSAADRHHTRAMKKLRALVGDDPSLLSPASLGLAAYLACKGGQMSGLLDAVLTPARELVAIGTEAASLGARRIADLARSLWPFSDTATLAASGGWGRAAGVCTGGLVALACGLGASGVLGPGLSGRGASSEKPTPARSGSTEKAAQRPLAAPPLLATPALPVPKSPMPDRPEQVESAKTTTADRAQARRQRALAPRAPEATHEQVEGDFGIGGRTGPASEPEPEPEPTPAQTPSQASEPSGSAAPSPPKSAGSSTRSEFGL